MLGVIIIMAVPVLGGAAMLVPLLIEPDAAIEPPFTMTSPDVAIMAPSGESICSAGPIVSAIVYLGV